MRILQQFHKCIAKESFFIFNRYGKFKHMKKMHLTSYKIDELRMHREAMTGDALSYYWDDDYYSSPYNFLHEYGYMTAYGASGLSELPAKIKRHRKFKGRGYAT